METIRDLSKESFKRFVDKNLALDYLNKIKEKHTKVNHIIHKNLKLKNYLLASKQINTKLSRLIFHARSRMLDVKENFRNKYLNTRTPRNCPLDCRELDTQEHILWCDKIESENIVSKNNQPDYQDLFEEDCEKQKKIAAILLERFTKRKQNIIDRGEPHAVCSRVHE